MINLLPPTHKEQISYAKRNTQLLRLIKWLGLILICILLAFLLAHWHLNRTLATTKASHADKQARIKDLAGVEQEAQLLSGRLQSVRVLRERQTRFSELLADLARVTPQGAYINTISLTEDDQKPVSINATANSYAAAAGLRDAFASSPRIQAVDLTSISNPAPGEFKVDLTIGFKPGQFK